MKTVCGETCRFLLCTLFVAIFSPQVSADHFDVVREPCPLSQYDPSSFAVSTLPPGDLRQRAQEHTIAIPPEAEANLQAVYDEGVKSYHSDGYYNPTTIEAMKSQTAAVLENAGVSPAEAVARATTLVDQGLLMTDTRFPVTRFGTVDPTVKDLASHVREILAVRKKKGPLELALRSLEIDATNAHYMATMFTGLSRDRVAASARALDADIAVLKEFKRLEEERDQEIPSSLGGRGFPYGFRSSTEFHDFARGFSSGFGRAMAAKVGFPEVASAEYCLAGSSVTGVSYERKSEGTFRRAYGPQSDLDIYVIVSPELFAKLRGRFINEVEPGRSRDYNLKEDAENLERLGVTEVVRQYQEKVKGSAKKIAVSVVTTNYLADRFDRNFNFFAFP